MTFAKLLQTLANARIIFLREFKYNVPGDVTYSNGLQIQNLTLENLNGEPWKNYMTTNTHQTFDKFFAKTLHVDKLYAESINGVPISQAARISQENVIKGN